MIDVKCTACGQAFTVHQSQAGNTVACVRCRKPVKVPGTETDQARAEGSTTLASIARGSTDVATSTPPSFNTVRGSQTRSPININPFTAHDESLRRRRGFMLIALGLLLAWIMPEAQAAGASINWRFTGINMMLDGQLTALDRIIAGYPLALGGAAILLGAMLTAPLRGAWILGVAAIPILWADPIAMMPNWLTRLSEAVHVSQAQGLINLATLLGWMILMVAARARFYRPKSAAAYWTGLIGACVFLAGWVIPFDQAGPLVMQLRQAGRINVYQLIAAGGMTLSSLAGAGMLLMNVPGRDADIAWLVAGRAGKVLLLGPAVFVIAHVIMAVAYAGDGMLLSSLWTVVKLCLWAVCLAGVWIIGATDVLVGKTPAAPTRPAASH